ncbi:MAG: NADP-dependent oxidoreductase, partial [Alphaproteobacteria bacterium]
TAYFGLMRIGRPEAGDTLVVSGAAGSTGATVAQLGRIMGCRVIGIAGGAEKCEWLMHEARIEAVIDYKSQDVMARLGELAPDGIDVFYDNVGGAILDAALAHIAHHGRIVVCGAISQYNTARPAGPSRYLNLILRRARMEGFIVTDFAAEFPKAQKRLAQWIREGEIVYREDVQTGFENAPRTFLRLFSGANRGKQLLKVAEPG